MKRRRPEVGTIGVALHDPDLVIPHPRWLSTAYCVMSLALFAILEMGLVRIAPQMPVSRDVFRVANDLSVVFTVLLIGGCLSFYSVYRKVIGGAEKRGGKGVSE